MTGLTLFDIEDSLHELMTVWQDAQTPEQIEAAETAIREYAESEIRKVDNIRRYLNVCATMAEAAKHEAQVQVNRQKAWESRRDQLKAFVFDVMQRFGLKKLEGQTGSFRVQANGGKLPLVISDESMIPDHLMEMYVTMTFEQYLGLRNTVWEKYEDGIEVDGPHPSNERIRKTLEAGEPVPGARLGDKGEHLRIV
jgi:hypothetical protein